MKNHRHCRRRAATIAAAALLSLSMATAAEPVASLSKNTRVETITIRHPWGHPELGENRDFLLLRIHADNGLVGISRGGSRHIIEEELVPILIGRDAHRISHL